MILLLASLITLSWKHPQPERVFYRVYEQTVAAPKPYWANANGVIVLRCDVVTTAWLTNGWKLVGSTPNTHFAMTNANDGLLHAFTVTAVDWETLIESGPATK